MLRPSQELGAALREQRAGDLSTEHLDIGSELDVTQHGRAVEAGDQPFAPPLVAGPRDVRADGHDPDRAIMDTWVLGWLNPEREWKMPARQWFPDWRERDWGPVTTQDYENVWRVQRGMKSRGFDGLRCNPRQESNAGPRLRLLILIVLTATVFGSLEAIREGWGRWSAVLVTCGLAVSLLPILLRVLPPLQRDARTQQRDPHYWITVLGLAVYAVIVLLIVAHP